MRTEPHSIAYPAADDGSAFYGHWPLAGFSSIAYRLANVRMSRFMTLFGLSALFYFS